MESNFRTDHATIAAVAQPVGRRNYKECGELVCPRLDRAKHEC
jgi:hypothetical protein